MPKHTVALDSLARKVRPPKKSAAAPIAISDKTALVLSGGGSRGAYQIGVWRALREFGLHIDIAVGTSIGALNAAAVAQNTYDSAEALWRQLETDMVFDYAHAFENRGVKFTTIKDILRQNIIEENIRSSPVDFGIVTVKFPSLEPVYLWKEDIPEGEMLDYILASSSCFPAVTPYEIHDAKFLDGSFYDSMPISLALEKGAGKIIAVNLDPVGKVRKEDLELAKGRLTLVECYWDLGSFLIFDKENTKHIMRLGYLDTLKAFDVLDGYRYAFAKGQMDLRNIKTAEYAGVAFGLDPEIIYTQETFMRALKKAISQYNTTEDKNLADLREGIKKLSLLQIEKTIENIGQLSKRTILVAIADFLKKQSAAAEEPKKKSVDPSAAFFKALKRLLDQDVKSAEWLLKTNLL
jgi:NTE family protein